jgi:hypothetical protein
VSLARCSLLPRSGFKLGGPDTALSLWVANLGHCWDWLAFSFVEENPRERLRAKRSQRL